MPRKGGYNLKKDKALADMVIPTPICQVAISRKYTVPLVLNKLHYFPSSDSCNNAVAEVCVFLFGRARGTGYRYLTINRSTLSLRQRKHIPGHNAFKIIRVSRTVRYEYGTVPINIFVTIFRW